MEYSKNTFVEYCRPYIYVLFFIYTPIETHLFIKKRGRKKKIRDINYTPALTIRQPLSGTKEPLSVQLGHDELEAMRLKYVNGLGIITAAKQMNISKSLFANILNEALRKVSQALVFGRAMEIEIGQGEFLQPML